eukprot:CAMPEP_0196820206 /NCGR_PEP_ID=MMETSP1362-20130617/74208_1 /TAXON_ID=163516 /ORGANISM="Leptocylindrus danicus, Strain CCMP1856" /LENGTH=422 /DNA_ID=CAMNT_0042198991 /DNA_START=248 /DNA_END=1512 /DNA_ORIENTATION=+
MKSQRAGCPLAHLCKKLKIFLTSLVVILSLGARTIHAVDVDTELNNGRVFPLAGLGLGNQQPGWIDDIIQNYPGLRLIDTAHASRNEAIISKALVQRAVQLDLKQHKIWSEKHKAKLRGSAHQEFDFFHEAEAVEQNRRVIEQTELHIITKVWYTHLGYERTLIAVEESLDAFRETFDSPLIDLKLTVLLHWPRCDPDIEWMHCEQEERDLPQGVKDAGPDPTGDRDAWKQSWKALEELYSEGKIYGIGVSNFSWEEMKELLNLCRVVPQIYQGSAWQSLFDPYLINQLKEENILYNVYNVMGAIVKQNEKTPNAYNCLTEIGRQHTKLMEAMDKPLSVSTVVLAWYIQHGYAIVPRSANSYHFLENSPLLLAKVPPFKKDDDEKIEQAIRAIMTQKDIAHGVLAYFTNTLDSVEQISLSYT